MTWAWRLTSNGDRPSLSLSQNSSTRNNWYAITDEQQIWHLTKPADRLATQDQIAPRFKASLERYYVEKFSAMIKASDKVQRTKYACRSKYFPKSVSRFNEEQHDRSVLQIENRCAWTQIRGLRNIATASHDEALELAEDTLRLQTDLAWNAMTTKKVSIAGCVPPSHSINLIGITSKSSICMTYTFITTLEIHAAILWQEKIARQKRKSRRSIEKHVLGARCIATVRIRLGIATNNLFDGV